MMRRRGPGLIGAAATTAVVAGTAGRVRHRQAQKYAAQDATAQQQAAPPPPAAVDEDDPMVQVQKLADLHASGALSDEEFAAAKAKVLGI